MGYWARIIIAALCGANVWVYAATKAPFNAGVAAFTALMFFSILADTKEWK